MEIFFENLKKNENLNLAVPLKLTLTWREKCVLAQNKNDSDFQEFFAKNEPKLVENAETDGGK